MKTGRRHRVNVLADDATWRRFRVLVIESGSTLEQRLGELVIKDVRSGTARKSAAQKRREVNARELRKAIREVEADGSSSSSSSSTRRTSSRARS